MTYKHIYLPLIILMFLSSCKSLEHWADASDKAQFDNYATYRIDDECSEYNKDVNPITQQRVRNAIEIEMRKMGLSPAESPDLEIKFVIKNETNYFYQNCAPEYQSIEGGKYCVDKIFNYQQGTLAIDFIETERNLAVWHGGGKGHSWDKMDNINERTYKLVKTILSEYPNNK